jgi:hypothetical protein
MVKRRGCIVGTAAVGLLLLTGCENIPYYNESLNWFSWSEYDPEVKAIQGEIPPPGGLEAPAAPDDGAALVRDGRGGYVYAPARRQLGQRPGGPGLTAGRHPQQRRRICDVAKPSRHAITHAPLPARR